MNRLLLDHKQERNPSLPRSFGKCELEMERRKKKMNRQKREEFQVFQPSRSFVYHNNLICKLSCVGLVVLA
jgi:hypothetical protein